MIQEETAAKVKEIEAECEAKKNPSMLSRAMALGRRLLALVSGGEEPAGDDLSGKLREAERSWNSAESRLWQMKAKEEVASAKKRDTKAKQAEANAAATQASREAESAGKDHKAKLEEKEKAEETKLDTIAAQGQWKDVMGGRYR